MSKRTRNISDDMSCKISHLMFVLSILVIYIHFADYNYVNVPAFRWEYTCEYFVSQCLGRVAVPLFFCISGYLCFSKKEITAKSLVKAYKTKIRTLVIPYLLWNIFYTLIFVVLQWNALGKIENLLGVILKSVFLYGSNYVLWYVFQLIFLTLLSPLLFYIYRNKYITLAFVFFACGAYIFISNPPIWLPLFGLAFYSLGATIALHFRKIVDSSLWDEKNKKIIGFAALCIFVVLCVLRMASFDITRSIHAVRATPLCRFLEMGLAFAFWFAIDLLGLSKKSVRSFERCSFLIYVTHNLAITAMNTLIEIVHLNITPSLRLGIYLIGPILITLAIVWVSSLLLKIAPKFYALISGGR